MAGEYTERQIRDMHLKIEIDEGSGFCYGVVLVGSHRTQ